jgi:hypothetical protein
LLLNNEVWCYNVRKKIWDIDFTAVVYISEKLLQGQIRGIEQNINKLFKKLSELKEEMEIQLRNSETKGLER